MANKNNNSQPSHNAALTHNSSWKPMAYGIGSVAGVLVGLLAAHFYTQAIEQNQEPSVAGSRPKMSPLDVVSLATMLLGVIRQITDLGARNANNT